ncbi:MAG: serine/threonine protein kinase [Planctomycetes bacterium]|nr:serine/threonine protein kinase [Planctomycetota bacterium]
MRGLFDQLLDLPPVDRDAMLVQVRAQDAAVERAVSELLRELDAESSKFADPLRSAWGSTPIEGLACGMRAADSPEPMPSQIGPFRIERIIGRGGMGVVYLAHQSNPVREVALKVLRDGAGTASLRARFAREVSALGRLEHPGIARIYEAGAAPMSTGEIAYFAMEFVRGPRITDFAAGNHLDINDRVELVARVADAVQHAHARGIIHRDLKPGNILIDEHQPMVTGAGNSPTHSWAAQPKVLDFGVARLLDQDSHQTALTEQGLLVGTVAYMSPEQLAGDPHAIDIRTDVYALGIILFELLAGKLPFDVLNTPIAEAARIIRDEEPPLLATTTISGTPTSISRDLRTIVTKAMSKSRDSRYETAAALSDDLRRYLRNEPILARRPTATYQLAKFARRHRTLVVSAAAVTLAITAGLIISITLFLREQQARGAVAKEAQLTSAVRGYMIEGLLMSAAPERMGYDVKMLDVLSHAADGLHERFADHPEIEAEVRADLSNVYLKLGRYPESLVHAEQAFKLFRGCFAADHPKVVNAQFRLANLAGVMHQPEKALEIASEAFPHARVAFANDPGSLLSAIGEYGAALNRGGRHDEALVILREGVALSSTFPPDDRDAELSTLTILNWLATSERAKGNQDQLLPLARQIAERTARVCGPSSETTLTAKSNLVAELVAAKQVEEAAELGSTLPALAEKILAPGHPGHGYCALTAAAALRLAGRFEEAERFALQGYDAMVKAFDEYNWTTDRAIALIRQVYATWPGHSDQQREWTLRNARLHLMTSKADQLDGTMKSLERICGQFAESDFVVSPSQLLKLVWQSRDRLAPLDHPRRAVFLAALAALAERLGSADYVPDALSLARKALPTSDDAAAVNDLLDTVRTHDATDRQR